MFCWIADCLCRISIRYFYINHRINVRKLTGETILHVVLKKEYQGIVFICWIIPVTGPHSLTYSHSFSFSLTTFVRGVQRGVFYSRRTYFWQPHLQSFVFVYLVNKKIIDPVFLKFSASSRPSSHLHHGSIYKNIVLSSSCMKKVDQHFSIAGLYN